jgi:hypothetical protein
VTSVTLPSPPPSLRVYALKAFLVQTQDLISFRDPSKTASVSKKLMLVERGWSGPYTNSALDRVRKAGKDAETVLFDASSPDVDGWTLEDVGRIVSFRPNLSGHSLLNTAQLASMLISPPRIRSALPSLLTVPTCPPIPT